MSLKKKKKKTQANLGEFSKPELISKNRNSWIWTRDQLRSSIPNKFNAEVWNKKNQFKKFSQAKIKQSEE
jgi:hypothetical protein